jgi:catechol 2,3-dioxygenase-like lactoylglutathione lyase family enzyme
VRTGNGVPLDYADAAEFRRQHYAFLVSEAEFDAALARIKEAGIAFDADFNRAGRGEINHLSGGRGVYFEDPDGRLGCVGGRDEPGHDVLLYLRFIRLFADGSYAVIAAR